MFVQTQTKELKTRMVIHLWITNCDWFKLWNTN